MDDIRSEIIRSYTKLSQLEDFESFLDHVEGGGKNHWWSLNSPHKTVAIKHESRNTLIGYIKNEIVRLKDELGLTHD